MLCCIDYQWPIMKPIRSTLVLLVCLALASCGGNEGSSQSALQRGIAADPESLDPHKTRSTQAAEVLRDIGEGLLGYSATGELVPAVAASWTVSEDGRTYTFKLRPGARWSNGDPLLAEHFVFALRRLVDPSTASPYALALEDIVNAAEIVAGTLSPTELGVASPDAQTLQILLRRPVPYLLGLLTHPSAFPLHPGSVAEHGDAFSRAGNSQLHHGDNQQSEHQHRCCGSALAGAATEVVDERLVEDVQVQDAGRVEWITGTATEATAGSRHDVEHLE